jgi:ABC-type branched-subunit amino acid transport system substrate-binding protein
MRARWVAVLATIALVAAACGNAGDDDAADDGGSNATVTTSDQSDLDKKVDITGVPGVTDDEIRVVTITATTNIIGGQYGQLADGIQAYFDMVNADGGIYGRKLVISKKRDDQMGQNAQTVQASLAEDDAFATFVATTLFTGAPALAKAKMPTFIWNINPEFTGNPTFFAQLGSLCFGCPGKIIPWLAEQLGAEKVAILAYGVSDQSIKCGQGNKKAFETYPTADVVFYDDSIGFRAQLSAQVSEMKKRGVQFVTTCMDGQESIVLAKEMRKQGLDAVQHLPNGYDYQLVAENAELLEGSIVIPQFTALEHEPQIPAWEDFSEWIGKLDKRVVETTIVGWILAHEFVTGLKLVGPDFDQEKLVGALNTLTDYDADGMIAPIDWTKAHIDPVKNEDARGDLECANFVEVKGGEFVPKFAEPGKPWVCFDREATDVSSPENMSFADSEG